MGEPCETSMNELRMNIFHTSLRFVVGPLGDRFVNSRARKGC